MGLAWGTWSMCRWRRARARAQRARRVLFSTVTAMLAGAHCRRAERMSPAVPCVRDPWRDRTG
eukprot:9724790-Alexandrium_andersonii.AAC.1